MTNLTNEELIQLFLSTGITSTSLYRDVEKELARRISWAEDGNETPNKVDGCKVQVFGNVTFTGIGHTPDCKCTVPKTWRVFKGKSTIETEFDEDQLFAFGVDCVQAYMRGNGKVNYSEVLKDFKKFRL